MSVKKSIRTIFLIQAVTTQVAAYAAEGSVPVGAPPMPALDHVFLIVLENHSYADIRGNVLAPFINQMANQAAVATNYSATTHPSLPNYLSIVGGSDFNVASDNSPDWHNTSCTPFTDIGAVCPIDGSATEVSTGTANILGKTIAEQLSAKGLTWKSYQQSLPSHGADGVDFSDDMYSNLTNFSAMLPNTTPPTTNDDMVSYIPHLYAVKHNPFVYFKTGQTSASLQQHAGFAQLYSDLRASSVANLSFIVPNQCNDEHGVGNSEIFCSYEPALIDHSDKTVSRIVKAIKASSAWKLGHNAIILVWDEDDYSASNQVLLIVDTNHGNISSITNQPYNHYSLLKTLEAGFRLPCLNHACDSNAMVMVDMFNFGTTH